ncbi:MAG: AcvB/VirJ family lysyl-phosphatidylglycerol hydrolase [Humidesulfovibrio sp.]|nr:AcvB/VirJ family lysyl-phosphatidylglycerol hydrolase [Humidesulfovibrio sp.]
MSRTTSALVGLLFLALCLATPACAKSEKAPEKLSFSVFGEVLIYRSTTEPGRAVLLLSDGPWDTRMDKAARTIADMDATVVGIDTSHLLQPLRAKAPGCLYQAWEFEGLSKIVQKTLGFKSYHLPVLAGFGEGAVVAYATLAQAPKNTFAGAIPLGFSPRLAVEKPFCAANGLRFETPGTAGGGVVFLPVEKPQGKLLLLQGKNDKRFSVAEAKSFASQVSGADVVALDGAGQAVDVDTKLWRTAFREALNTVAPAVTAPKPAASLEGVDDLPLVEVPAQHPSKTMAVVVTGDGGWAGIDQHIGETLAAHGVSVVGLNSLKYFWNAKTPDEMAHDLERTLTHYAAKWGADKYIVVGYSIGADVMPFMAGRMSEATKTHLAVVAMLGPGTHADFEFHLSNWLSSENVPEGAPMVPEMAKLTKVPVLLVCGKDEDGTLCQNYQAPNVTSMVLPGGHHFNKLYDHIAFSILRAGGIPVQE